VISRPPRSKRIASIADRSLTLRQMRSTDHGRGVSKGSCRPGNHTVPAQAARSRTLRARWLEASEHKMKQQCPLVLKIVSSSSYIASHFNLR
jgi:hypothetical protein